MPPPSKLKAIAGDKQIIFSWDNVTDAINYTIYVAEETGITPENYSVYKGGRLLDNVTSPYILSNLINGKTYYAIITSTTSGVESNASYEVFATPKKVVVPSQGKLNDTGITRCASLTDSDLDCPVTNYPRQDAEHGISSMSFSKIANGKCIKDNNTGLTWEVKQNRNNQVGDSLHDADDAYSWYEPDNMKNGGFSGHQNSRGNTCYNYQERIEMSYCNTDSYVQRVNFQGWCGYNDWRMPTLEELRSIVDYSGNYSFAINVDYFPINNDVVVWSSVPHAQYSDIAWYIYFGKGVDASTLMENANSIRLVRSEK